MATDKDKDKKRYRESLYDRDFTQDEKEAMDKGGIQRRESLLRSPEHKRARQIMTSVEKQAGLILQDAMTNVQDLLNKSLKEMEGTKGDEETEEESTEDDGQHGEKDKDIINSIIDAKQAIIKATTRFSSGKIQFNREDQVVVREQIERLTNILITLLGQTNIKQQDKEKDLKEIKETLTRQNRDIQILTHDIQKIKQTRLNKEKPKGTNKKLHITEQNTGTDMDTEQGVESTENQGDDETDTEKEWTLAKRRRISRSQTNKTYAEIATRRDNKGWTTPERRDTLTSVVSVNDVTEPRQTLMKVKEIIRQDATEQGGIKNIIPLQGGKLLLNFKDKEQRDMINNRLRTNTDIRLTTRETAKPKLRITGITKGYDNEELLQMITDENEDIRNNFGDRLTKNTKILTRRQCRNQFKENIVLETDTDIFKYIVKKGQIYLDLTTVYAEESVSVALCYQCHKYGHVHKHCKDKQTCHVCGGQHKGEDCKRTVPNCINCALAGIDKKDRQHTARDRNCPIYIRKERQARQNVEYGQTAN